jgi:hypothetical protein
VIYNKKIKTILWTGEDRGDSDFAALKNCVLAGFMLRISAFSSQVICVFLTALKINNDWFFVTRICRLVSCIKGLSVGLLHSYTHAYYFKSDVIIYEKTRMSQSSGCGCGSSFVVLKVAWRDAVHDKVRAVTELLPLRRSVKCVGPVFKVT